MSWGWVFPGGRYIQGLGMSREGRHVQLGGGCIWGWVCPGGGYVWGTDTHPWTHNLAYHRIQLASGQYTSYWNAFLLNLVVLCPCINLYISSYCFIMSCKTQFSVFSTQVIMKSDVYVVTAGNYRRTGRVYQLASTGKEFSWSLP